MKFKKWFLILSILISYCMGASGCMNKNINKDAYKGKILSFLEEKYQEEFFVKEMYQEFEGDNGMIVRALCEGTTYKDEFLVCCYLDSSVEKELVEIEGNVHSISDEYSEVIFQNQLLEAMNMGKDDILFVKCNVDFYGWQPSKSQVDNGIEYCLQDEELNAYVKVYIISEDNVSARDMQERAEQIMLKYQPCTGYVYYVVNSNLSRAEIQEIYLKNQHDFGNYLTSSDIAETLEFTLYKKKTGLQTREKIRR